MELNSIYQRIRILRRLLKGTDDRDLHFQYGIEKLNLECKAYRLKGG